MNRIACCALKKWENGKEDLILQLLRGVRTAVQKLVVVMEAQVPEQVQKATVAIADQVVLLDNIAWDGWAYRSCMEELGWETLSKADEVLFFSGDCFGPVESVKDFLDALSAQNDCDFWEITGCKHPALCKHFGLVGFDFMMGLRKPLLSADAFHAVIQQIRPTLLQTEAALGGEFWLGERLTAAGFTEKVLIASCGSIPEDVLYRFDQLFIAHHVPLIPLEAFMPELTEEWFTHSDCAQFSRLLAYIRQHKFCDEQPLWKYVLSRITLTEAKTRFGLFRISTPPASASAASNKRTALLMYVPSLWHAEIFAPYIHKACDMRMQTMLFYSRSDVRSELECRFPQVIFYQVGKQSTRIASECLIAAKNLIHHTDYICCMLHTISQGTANDFAKEQYLRGELDTLLQNGQTLSWIAEQFEAEPSLGMIQCEPVTHSHYYAMASALMQNGIVRLLQKIHISLGMLLPFDSACELPTLSCWMRSTVLQTVLEHSLTSKVISAITATEYSFGYFLRRYFQLQGYYPLYICTPERVQTEMLHRGDSVRRTNELLTSATGRGHFYRYEMFDEIARKGAAEPFARSLSGREILSELRRFLKYKHMKLFKKAISHIEASVPEKDQAPQLWARLEACQIHCSRVRLLLSSNEVQLDRCFLTACFRKYYPLDSEDALLMKQPYTKRASSLAVYEVPMDMLQSGVSLLWAKNIEIGLKCGCDTALIQLKQNRFYLGEGFQPEAHSYDPKKVRRLGIFFFFDAQGVVDEYVVHYLKAFQTVCSENCVVVNGQLKAEGRARLESCCDRLIVRENIGFDSAAYKAAILDYGYTEIAEGYDELVLHNFTDYGPLHPFNEMMDKMSARDNDFWGHCRYVPQAGEKLEGHELQDHLMSYYLVFKKKVLSSEAFKEYWESIQLPSNYVEAVLFHEMRCTEYFEKRGFVSDSYMPETKYHQMGNATVFCPYTQLVEDRSPLLKRKVFFVKDGYFAFRLHSSEPSVYKLLTYVRDHTDYDPMLILENIVRTQNIEQLPIKDANKREHTMFSYLKFLNSCKETETDVQ